MVETYHVQDEEDLMMQNIDPCAFIAPLGKYKRGGNLVKLLTRAVHGRNLFDLHFLPNTALRIR